ncbi:hypothetical protein F4780DRAFT_607312 [Xylariomycetidae sp. FL0641]|nr:hypothetical protein F4780DRAFT_607312 [Xylariomycetidae sp. FL0641]
MTEEDETRPENTVDVEACCSFLFAESCAMMGHILYRFECSRAACPYCAAQQPEPAPAPDNMAEMRLHDACRTLDRHEQGDLSLLHAALVEDALHATPASLTGFPGEFALPNPPDLVSAGGRNLLRRLDGPSYARLLRAMQATADMRRAGLAHRHALLKHDVHPEPLPTLTAEVMETLACKLGGLGPRDLHGYDDARIGWRRFKPRGPVRVLTAFADQRQLLRDVLHQLPACVERRPVVLTFGLALAWRAEGRPGPKEEKRMRVFLDMCRRAGLDPQFRQGLVEGGVKEAKDW